jgi:phage host-nuclease inhibitor protein Gam
MLIAKVEVELFAGQIDKLKSRMFDETVRATTHWFDLAERVGARAEIEVLLKQSVAQFCQAIGSEALKIAETYAELLREADAAWRQKYPDKISDFDKPSG